METTFNTHPLSISEMALLNGGEVTRIIFYYDLPSYFLLKSIYEFAKDAAEFQSSLPPNLKK